MKHTHARTLPVDFGKELQIFVTPEVSVNTIYYQWAISSVQDPHKH